MSSRQVVKSTFSAVVISLGFALATGCAHHPRRSPQLISHKGIRTYKLKTPRFNPHGVPALNVRIYHDPQEDTEVSTSLPPNRVVLTRVSLASRLAEGTRSPTGSLQTSPGRRPGL